MASDQDPTQRVEATTTPEGGEGWETVQARHNDTARGHGVDVAPDPQPEGIRAETRRRDDGDRGEPGNAPTAAAPRMRTVRLKVVVYEDGEEKQTLDVGYFVGQPYTVKIDTPDGVDAQYEGRTS